PRLMLGPRGSSRRARFPSSAPWSRLCSSWFLPQVAPITTVEITHARLGVQTGRASTSGPGGAVLGVAKADRRQAVGFDVWVGEDAGAVLGEVDLRLDREGCAVACGGELGDDLAVVGREGDGARMGDQGRWGDLGAGGLGAEGELPGTAETGAAERVGDRYL